MRPIEQKTETTLSQALKCAQFRMPLDARLRKRPLEMGIGLRYGLIGIAASHHVLLSCPDDQERALVRQLHGFSGQIEDHFRQVVIGKMPYGPDVEFPHRMGRIFERLLDCYLPLYHRLCPLDLCLSVICDDFTYSHRKEIAQGVPLLSRSAAKRTFHSLADQSFAYALTFFERRQAGIEEVAEIALLGE
ncbi:MAG TPA: hypothetical protein VG944_02600 [Fimbriimonas sp.]|nr:hypothetical protein [Fimbriimonas sp.]